MIFTIVGAGAIGSTVAHYLAGIEAVSEVRVCDSRARSLQQLRQLVPSSKLKPFQVDGRDIHVLGPISAGSSCMISCVEPALNPSLAELAVSQGMHFCDQGGSDANASKTLPLEAAAREKGVWIVPNCGLAPGLVNILALLAADRFHALDDIRIRVGDIPVHPEPPFNFRISSSASKIIDDYTRPATLIEDGYSKVVQPLSRLEHIFFDEPYGLLESFCSAVSVETLAWHLEGQLRNLDLKTISWPGHAEQMSFVLALGLGDARSVDVRTHLTYRDILVRRMTERMAGDHEDVVLMRILVNGKIDDVERALVVEMVDHYDADLGLSAMRRCTSIPTAIIALMLASGGVDGAGAAPPELILPKTTFREKLEDWGLNITERWYDGYQDVTDPSASDTVPVSRD